MIQEFKDKTPNELNSMVNQYKPLIEKIVNQQWNSMTPRQQETLEKDDIRGYALEGFARALNDYDDKRSKMTFKQYVAFTMKNNCLTGINEDSRTIKVSFYNQGKLKDKNQSTILTTSIERIIPNSDDDTAQDHFSFLGIDNENEIENPIDVLVDYVKRRFDSKTNDMFLSFYGLDGRKDEKGKDIAARYNVSSASVSLRIKNVIDDIKENKQIKESLMSLL